MLSIHEPKWRIIKADRLIGTSGAKIRRMCGRRSFAMPIGDISRDAVERTMCGRVHCDSTSGLLYAMCEQRSVGSLA